MKGINTLAILAVVAVPLAARAQSGDTQQSLERALDRLDDQTKDDESCAPACRDGFVCQAGTCVSACNPVCDAGEMCTGDGQCVARIAQAQPGMPGAPGTSPYLDAGEPDELPGPGWAPRAVRLGYTSAAVTALLGGIATATDDDKVGIPVGALATVQFGVAVPIVAAGGASARAHGGARGNRPLRIVSWVGYAVTLLDAASVLGVSIGGGYVSDAHAASITALGVLTTIGFTLDAASSAQQASRTRARLTRRASGVTLAPRAALSIDPSGSSFGMLGVGGTF